MPMLIAPERLTFAFSIRTTRSFGSASLALMADIGPPVPPPITRMSVSMISVFVADSKALMARSRVDGVEALVRSPRGRIGDSGGLRRGGRADDGLGREGTQVSPGEDPAGVTVGESDMDGIAAHGFDAGDRDVGEGVGEAVHDAIAGAPRAPTTKAQPLGRQRSG